MITIFQGRKISLDGTQDEIYAQVAVSLRDQLHLFNTGKSLNPFGVFMCISLHADANGWAWPSRGLIKKETGISTDHAIGGALKHLRSMKMHGFRFLKMYRQYHPATKQWGRTAYRIFPDAFESMEGSPFANLVEWEPEVDRPTCNDPQVGDPQVDRPQADRPQVENPQHMKDTHPKEIHLKDTHLKNTTPPPSTADGDAPAGQEGPTPGRKLEYLSFPGFSVVEVSDVHVVTIHPEPTDKRLTCPDCEHVQDWPPSETRRRKPASLICGECGAFFKVVGYKVSGKNWTYQLDAARRGGKMKVTVPKARGRFRVFGCDLRQAKELALLWQSAGEEEVVSILDWMHRDVTCDDDEVAHILLQSARTRRARRAAKNVPEPVIVRADDDTDFVSGFPDDFFDE